VHPHPGVRDRAASVGRRGRPDKVRPVSEPHASAVDDPSPGTGPDTGPDTGRDTDSRDTGDVTALLVRWKAGDAGARDQLAAAIYSQLKRIAANRLREQARPVVDPTELVHEALMKLIQSPIDAEDRRQLFKIAAAALRHTLIDLVRRRDADKRGGGEVTSLDALQITVAGLTGASADHWLDVEHALTELEALDPRKCRIAELALIVGLEQTEIAATLGLSLSTVERDLRFARAWLKTRLSGATPQNPDTVVDRR